MELIAMSIRIYARQPKVLKAITTTAGYRGWWTEDCDVGRAVGEEAIFRFGGMEVTFRIDRLDSCGIELTCVRQKNIPEWLGTHVVLLAIEDGDGTFVDLIHEGYATKSDVYEISVSEWNRYLDSLSSYCESGRGEPQKASRKITPRKSA